MSEYKSYEDRLLETFLSRKIFLVTGSVNGKYGIDGLAAIAMMNKPEEVYKGSVFVFCSKSQKQLKFLLWENNGYWMINRKIYKKSFAWPSSETKTEAVESAVSLIKTVLTSVGKGRGDMISIGSQCLNIV